MDVNELVEIVTSLANKHNPDIEINAVQDGVIITRPLHQCISEPADLCRDSVCVRLSHGKPTTIVRYVDTSCPALKFDSIQWFKDDLEKWLTPPDLSRFEEDLRGCLLKKGWESAYHYRGITAVKGHGQTFPLHVSVRNTTGTTIVSIVTEKLYLVYKVYNSSKLVSELADVLDKHWCPDTQERITEKISFLVRDSMKGFIGRPVTADAVHGMQTQVTEVLSRSIDYDSVLPIMKEALDNYKRDVCKFEDRKFNKLVENSLAENRHSFKRDFKVLARNLQAFKQMWDVYASYQFEPVKEYVTPDWVITPENRRSTKYIGKDIFPYDDDL